MNFIQRSHLGEGISRQECLFQLAEEQLGKGDPAETDIGTNLCKRKNCQIRYIAETIRLAKFV